MKTLIFLYFLLVILGGCPSATLLDAIEKNDQNVEILYQVDVDKVVFFNQRFYRTTNMKFNLSLIKFKIQM